MEHKRFAIAVKVALVLAVFALGGVVGIYQYFARDLPSTARLENFEPSLKTRVYAEDSTLVGELYQQNRVLIPLEDIPQHMIDAIIAIEDRKFYSHWGVDLFGILRATIANLRAGEIVQGASTITQQLARNLFTMFDVSITRKIKEMILALKIERTYSKDEILEMYLNQIYFGSGAYGVEAAAREFFAKGVKDLTLDEATLLAGLPKNPRDYSPHYNLDRALQRRRVVLKAMVDAGKLDQAFADSAATREIKLGEAAAGEQFAAYFLEHVRRYLEDKYGADRIYHDGLRVYTTLDPYLQRVAEDSLEAHMLRTETSRRYDQTKEQYEELILAEKDTLLEYIQSAVVAIEPQTGYVRAMVGGRSFRHSSWNRAVQARRQPGSAFKPFIYIAAIENGYTPADIVLDAPIVLDLPNGDVYKPRNFKEKFEGEITMRYALNKSINVAAVRVLLSLGPESAINYAHRLGIKSPLQPVYSLALGTGEVTLMEITSAYGTIAAGGVRAEPIAVKSVYDRDGKLLEENAVYREEVLSPQTSFLITNMLESTVNEGTGIGARLMGFVEPVAGKTGTTDDYTDAWFVGFTPELVVGVWTGFDVKKTMGRNMTGARASLPTWTQVMKAYYRNRSGEPFTEPEGIVHRVVCEKTGLLASSKCKRARREIFIDGAEPRRPCDHCAKEYTLIRTLPNLDDYDDADRRLLDDDDDYDDPR
ncbi:MAG: PBP1A family penicillin-binding protein [Candidatus Latescibacterota bacterium]|nr:MAG: PBP1A family penicillin-binding protein [Candidatus Latescibacterota bacterium]